MFGKFNMKNLMANAEMMKEKMEQIEVKGEAGAGEVTVEMNARHIVKKVTLSESILQEPREIIEELIAAAMNDAARKIEDAAQNQMMDMSSMLGSLMGEKEEK